MDSPKLRGIGGGQDNPVVPRVLQICRRRDGLVFLGSTLCPGWFRPRCVCVHSAFQEYPPQPARTGRGNTARAKSEKGACCGNNVELNGTVKSLNGKHQRSHSNASAHDAGRQGLLPSFGARFPSSRVLPSERPIRLSHVAGDKPIHSG
jgi:hypothetical protein